MKQLWRSLFAALGLVSLLAVAMVPARFSSAQVEQRFPETQHWVKGLFLQYWQEHGGLAQQGYPLTEEFQEVNKLDGQTYTVQYFERAVFEHHPENAGTPYEVLLSQLGTFELKSRYPDSAPASTASTENPQPFPQTGHTLGGKFRAYWESHGGLAQQGYPLTDEFTETNKLNGQPYTVQYFERAIFEWHQENAGTPYEVLLSQLGKFELDSRYPNNSNPAAGPVGTATPPATTPLALPTGTPTPIPLPTDTPLPVATPIPTPIPQVNTPFGPVPIKEVDFTDRPDIFPRPPAGSKTLFVALGPLPPGDTARQLAIYATNQIANGQIYAVAGDGLRSPVVRGAELYGLLSEPGLRIATSFEFPASESHFTLYWPDNPPLPLGK